jgi:hypothetical protein
MEEGRVGLEMGVDEESGVLVLQVSDIESQTKIQFAMTPDQAYSMAKGIIEALKTLGVKSPMASRGSETVH